MFHIFTIMNNQGIGVKHVHVHNDAVFIMECWLSWEQSKTASKEAGNKQMVEWNDLGSKGAGIPDTENFSVNVHATFDYIKIFAVFDTSVTATETVKGTYDLGLTSSDEKEETLTIYSFWPHKMAIATETNVSSGVNLQGTAEWK